MSSRFSAARPKRAGESFARAHHGERSTTTTSSSTGHDDAQDGPSAPKKVKFDVRNPSALAPDAEDEDEDNDAVLEADVIGKGAGATKRGAVNIDGYDSDSDNETFKDHNDLDVADVEIDIADQLDNYDKRLRDGGDGPGGEEAAEDEDEDMFAAEDDPDEEDANDPAGPKTTSRAAGRRAKEVRFLDADKIEGQEQASRSGGTVRLDEGNASSDDEEDLELAIQEEGVDEEVGMGGLKRNAPKIDAFNMKAEQEEGAFDEAGNFIRKAVDPDAVHDKWLDGVSKKDMKKAAEAHERREAELRRQRREEDSLLTEDLLKSLILHLELGETPLEALARLGRGRAKEKKVPKWKLKKKQQQHQQKNGEEGEGMDLDHTKEEHEDPKQAKIKEAINSITEAADKLLGREYADIYETEREVLIRDWQTEAGERWMQPTPAPVVEEQQEDPAAAASTGRKWEYRWIDGRDGGVVQGPYDGPAMKAWQDAGYFEGVEFRAVGEDGWSKAADFV
ncbi:hypothetical protein M406DRAFT_36875 [Cryphonectria parasitica EP155]|uniref:GYF domain-containing protein n=1 Tax=Cryphonectria parasitica (strain ATCC 38755 / EP155) TaxID=660469 RepID=A0A9P5CNY4_CRYP1|nr:uncharacterized protein M406DRAFT_36875 [Cryphonectria parasitica EP155]KAF3765949.1 hypothetical protein M406DRAFT_36875 [Cryphonectria parasitica EP155]